jgi:SNF2 family DNA or RNA helicase
VIVLHASALGEELFAWGETPAEEAPVEPKRRGRRPTNRPPPWSPYDAGAESVASAVAAACDAEPDELEHLSAIAWLPTAGGKPVASSPLVADTIAGATKIAPWSVGAVRLAPSRALMLLAACAGAETLAPGVLVGRDLAFWAAVAQLAGALVVRQQFLPGLAHIDGEFFARWGVAATGADTARVASFAKNMPHACRAISLAADCAPEAPAADVLAGPLGAFVDLLARGEERPAPPRPVVHRNRGPRTNRTWAPVPREFDSVHDEWIYALRSADGRMCGNPAELARLADEIREWRRPLSAAATAPFRLCFRLEEPESDVDRPAASARATWHVRYLLQDIADPSLLVPAAHAWSPKGAARTALARRSFDARAYLLPALGQAASLSSQVEASLASPTPSGYDTDATGAHDFLTRAAWLLEGAGFGVLLPAWWTRKGTKMRLTARASVSSSKLKASSGLSLDEVVRVDWQVALGGETIGLAELQALAKLKAPLVRVRGQWIELSADEIQAALDFWKRKGSQTSARDVVKMALRDASRAGALEVDGVEASGWLGELLARLGDARGVEELPPPEGLRATLRPYQVRGYSWLEFLRQWGFGACLADDMGLGKSVQTLALLERDWRANGRRPSLIVCPTSVVANWQKEAARFTPGLPVMVHHGTTRTKGVAFRKAAAKHAIVVSTYALLHRDAETLASVEWRGVILDEAQNVKNAETKQARAARALPADFRVALTGTPVENNVGDLWSIMEFLNPGWLGTQAEFRRRFFLPIQTSRDPEATARLKRMTGPFVLRRLKTDKSVIADLPEKLEMRVFCTLTKEQASLYQAVADEAAEMLEDVSGMKRRGLVLATLVKLKQVCNHPAQFLGDNSSISGRSGKLSRLTEMLEEALAEGDRALVFTQFAEMGEILKRHLQESFGREALFLHGGVPKRQRDSMVERFQSAGGPRVFVLSLKAGGTGLNLTAANHVFHFDRWWNPAVENQATDRAFRIGQTRNVQVHKFVCAGTLEEKVDEMIEAKKEVAERVVGTGESWLTELSTAELKDLFALGRDAVGE